LKALLLAGGFGNRLRPITKKIPKCLVPINKKPLLDYWIYNLLSSNFDSLLINTHYLPEEVRGFINQHPLKEKIDLVHEDNLLGTAGTLKQNIEYFNKEEGLLVHADNYCTADFKEFINHHRTRPKECLITMMIFNTETPESCGIVELDEKGIVKKFHEKDTTLRGNLANGAIYMLSKEFLSIYEEDFKTAIDFSLDVIPNLLGKIFTYHTSAKIIDIGSLKTYYQLEKDIKLINSHNNIN
jgi:mannose-1-phosphate guanylyltransferase